MSGESKPRLRRVVISAAVLAAGLVFSLLALHPPHGRSAKAPAGQFSAIRALQTLHRILADDTPHPVGSAANAAVRVRIVGELTHLGYQPVVHTAFACSAVGACATVNNILARRDGSEPGPAVLLAAHYDSVPAGPGDSDDGVGVASVLEIARALKSLPQPRHSIILLIDDGEEAGLLGARAFVETDPWAKQVRAAVNLDDRGTSGPSLMFETGRNNDWALDLYSRHAARHLTNSIFYAIYKELPNDTDFTVFKRAGFEGLNFAFIGHEPLYHTPLDNSANVSVASLQDQGDNGLASIVALANADLAPKPDADAVYFDFFGREIVHWPGPWSLALGILSGLLLALEIGWLVQKRRLKLWEWLYGAAGWLAAFVGAGVAGLVLRGILGFAGATPVGWSAHPLSAEIAFALLGIAILIAFGSFVARSAGFWGLWSGAWAWGVLLSIIVGARLPGYSYVVLAPTILAVLGSLPAVLDSHEHDWARDICLIVPFAGSAIVLLPLISLLYSALGNQSLVAIALTTALLVTPLFPLCADLRQIGGFWGISLRWSPFLAVGLAAFVAFALPVYSAKSPERMNFDYALDADTGMGRWIAYPASGGLQPSIQLAGAFRKMERYPFPWDTRESYSSAAPHLDLAAPTFTILSSAVEGNRRSYRALLRSERGAPEAAVLFPPGSGVQSVLIEGQPVEPESPRAVAFLNGWAAYSCLTMPTAGINVSFALPVGKVVEVMVIDRSYGLPPEGAFLMRARPLTATPSQDGDLTVVTRRVQLFP